MYKGVAFALGACLIWGLIFIIPQFMEGFSSLEIALARYSFYGLASAVLFLKSRVQGKCKYPLNIWVKALVFSVASSFAYYIFVVLSVRYASPAICALILGIAPISIAFYGNWKEKECSYKSLIFPSFLILVGLVLINAPHMTAATSLKTYILGLLAAFWALLAWTWYVVVNARFLKKHPEVEPNDWSTIIGLATLVWAVIFGLVLGFSDQIQVQKWITPSPELTRFLVGAATLGLLCSWVGTYLWNRASFLLPVSLAGQLTIFETIFGILFVYALEHSLPPLFEGVGIALFLIAIVYGIKVSSQTEEERLPLLDEQLK